MFGYAKRHLAPSGDLGIGGRTRSLLRCRPSRMGL
jgi:hypothetical protein